MAMNFNRTQYAGRMPEIWRGECKMLPGGFAPSSAQNIAVGTVVRRGTPLCVDFSTMTAAVCKTAKVIGGTTSAVQVGKGHLFAVGDVVTVHGDGSATPTIRGIDTSNDAYDVLTLSTAYTGVNTGDVIVESETPASGDAVARFTPNCVAGADTNFDGVGIKTLDAAYEAVVLYPSLFFPLLDEWLEGFSLATNHSIKFIKQ